MFIRAILSVVLLCAGSAQAQAVVPPTWAQGLTTTVVYSDSGGVLGWVVPDALTDFLAIPQMKADVANCTTAKQALTDTLVTANGVIAQCQADRDLNAGELNTLRDIGNNGMDMMLECINFNRPECPNQAAVNGWLTWMAGYVKQRLIDGK
jgi:hypothetical protein